jgi:hypothetical protein
MGEKKVRLGSVTLLFCVAILCVGVLAALSVATVQGDRAVTQRYADRVTALYQQQSQGQQWLSQVDAALQAKGWSVTEADLPEDTTLTDGVIATLIQGDGLSLEIRLTLTDGGADTPAYRIDVWRETTDWEVDLQLNLWH